MDNEIKAYRLRAGDRIFFSHDAVGTLKLEVSEHVKNPNRKWLEFWKPRYIGYIFEAKC